MSNSRLAVIADTLVNQSVKVKPGDRVVIYFLEPAVISLVNYINSSVLEAGGFPRIIFNPNVCEHTLLNEGTLEQLEFYPDHIDYALKNSEVFIAIGGSLKDNLFADIETGRIKLRSSITAPLQKYRVNNMRWVLYYHPLSSMARRAGISLKEYRDIAYNALGQDYSLIKAIAEQLKPVFDDKQDVRIVGTGTDITLSLSGRYGRPCFGERNMPDGELCFAPVVESVNGTICFEWPIRIVGGKTIEGATLVFKDGEVVEYQAAKNKDQLAALLSAPGATRVGELGLGLNYGITKHLQETIYDEKIGGTIHIALGHSVPGTGGTNESGTHQDMVKDMRNRFSMIYVNNSLVFSAGRYLGLSYTQAF